MAARLATEDGIAAYRQRGHIAETRTGTSSTTCASASYRSAASPKPPPNAHSPAQCTTCSRPSPPATSPPPRWTTWPTRPPDRPAPLRQPRPGSHPGAARSHTRDTRPTRLPRHPHSARFSNTPLWIDHLFTFLRNLVAVNVLEQPAVDRSFIQVSWEAWCRRGSRSCWQHVKGRHWLAVSS